MNPSLFAALGLYWREVLTPPARWLLLIQLALMGARLPLAARPLPAWFVEAPSSTFEVSSFGIEATVLVAFLLQWCAWSEQLYSLRLAFQPSETVRGRAWRRFALHIYGGLLFLVVLSGLATLQPLLGIGAMFLLFMSGEAQDKKLEHQPIPWALPRGMGRSYRLISHEPWRFLGNLLLPGVVLYAGGVLLVWLRLWGTEHLWWPLRGLLFAVLLALWLGFFALAQLRIALRAEGELDVDVLMGEESRENRPPPSPSLAKIQGLIASFTPLCNALATLLTLLSGGWLLLRLADVGLLSTHALGMAFSAMVSLLSTTVSAFLSLLVKLGFISVVVAVLLSLLMLIVGLGRREPLKPLQKVWDRLQESVQNLAGSFKEFNLAKVGLGTLLTALGTVAVQTYDRVQKDQERQSIVRETLQRQQSKEDQRAQARLVRNDGLVARIQQRVVEFRQAEKPTIREQLLDQLLSDLRDVLPELTTSKGAVDGERKGKLLRYLYESGLLDSIKSTPLDAKGKRAACDDTAIRIEQRAMRAKTVQQDLRQAGCATPLILHAMDFSGASLEGAYLNNAFLPFIDLRYANLRGARLAYANLRFANLENADLTGAEVSGTDLRQTTLVGTNLSEAWSVENYPKLEGAVAFYAIGPQSRNKEERLISWDLVKGAEPWHDLKPGKNWNFCPLDPRYSSNIPAATPPMRISQAGSKCSNRRFDPQSENNSNLVFDNRDWSGSSLRQSTFKGMTLRGVTLAGADLSSTTFEDMTLQNVSFAGANLRDAIFKESDLDNVDFTGADLRGFRLEKLRRLRNPRYRGSVIDLEENKSFSPYRKNLLRTQVYDNRFAAEQGVDDVSSFRQNFFAPLLVAPLPLRPQQLLYWMLATPLPGAIVSEAVAPAQRPTRPTPTISPLRPPAKP